MTPSCQPNSACKWCFGRRCRLWGSEDAVNFWKNPLCPFGAPEHSGYYTNGVGLKAI
ncbi:MAG: hypothetical protein GF311_27490 [Candidatus Lokiarchaeota archaeon]|nr:hypothetical protein [Candidatus Lokiarchaeota archaeon]